MNVSFSVAMMLQAVNNMGPGIQSAQRMVNGLGQNIKDVARQTSNLNPVQGWENKINKVAEAAKRIGKELKESGKQIAQQGEKMQNSGMRNTAEGIGLMTPVLHIADKAGELQMKKTSMGMSGISGQGVEQLIAQADAYTQRTLFSKTEIADMFLSMRQSGMKEDNILRASEPLVMLSELENIRRGTDGRATAKVLAQMAERGGVLRDPNIERWNEFLEIVNQVTTVTTAGMHELHESSKYLEPVASIAGWNEKDMMMSQGIAARFGLEGSIAGTDLKDMIARLNPMKWFKEGRPAQQLDAMQRLGWLTDVESHKNKSGRTAYDKVGGSTMLNKDGTTVNMLEMFGQFAKSYANYKDLPNGRAKFAADMFKVLGEQGEKTALLVAQNYETVLQMLEDAEKVKPIHQQIDQYSKEYMQSQKAFKSSIENLEIDAGNLLLPNLTDAAKELRAWVNIAREFTTTHPGLVSGVLKFMLAMGVLKIGIGLVQLIFGTLMTTFGGGMTVFGWLSTGIGWVLKKLVDLKVGFSLFRGTGAGFWSSLWQGAQLVFPWLGKISSWFKGFALKPLKLIFSPEFKLVSWIAGNAKFVAIWIASNAKIVAVWAITQVKLLATWALTNARMIMAWTIANGRIALIWLVTHGQMLAIALVSYAQIVGAWIMAQGRMVATWLIAAARIAAGWFIAMGPVGWIILGVTAIIAAGIWAWNSNFIGFRDKCILAWNSISDWGKRTWDSICGFVSTAIDRVSGFIERVKEALGLSQKMQFYGPIKGVELDPGDHPFIGNGIRNNTNSITQHNHISLKTPEEAATFTQSAIPDKYQLSLNP